MHWSYPLMALIVMEGVADVFAKEYSLRQRPLLWCGAILSYIICNAFWLSAIKHGSGLARGALIFSVASGVLALVIGVGWYREALTRSQVIGALLGILSRTRNP